MWSINSAHIINCQFRMGVASSPSFIHSFWIFLHGGSIKSKPNWLCQIYLMPDETILKLDRYLENSIKNKIPTHHNILFNRQKDMSFWTTSAKMYIYEIIDNPLIYSRPHIQQTMLEILYIKVWCVVDLLLHHAPHFIIDRIQIWTVRRP